MATKASLSRLKVNSSSGKPAKKVSIGKLASKASTGTTKQKASLHQMKPPSPPQPPKIKKPAKSKPKGLHSGKPY